MYLARTPAIARALYGSRLWRMPAEDDGGKSIHLTFDDGPIPDVTPWVFTTAPVPGPGTTHRKARP